MAREILVLLRQRDTAALRSVGVVVEDVEGNNLRIQGVEGFREGAVVRKTRLSGDIQIGGIVSGTGGGAENPPEQ
ncbi:hypothetical protein [Longimicrobium sp.]|jgi:hypothetical protein|uniref:hypothetical protein n=1 Tax=Longimicrobium sp. TaxID=2029185 RepID=UPI002ED7DECF